ncbi:MAG TPA: hypothetical protein VN962_27195 [Polyangia bacterium]|nr:hypothetical protein [Polyangia bacterium]
MASIKAVCKSVGFALALLATASAGCFSSVDRRASGPSPAPEVNMVVGLPVSLGWGGAIELRRIQRRTSDSLLATTGGSAIIAEELAPGETGAQVAAALRAAGEDPARALTLAVSVRIGGRREPNVSPIRGFIVGNVSIVDYRVHVDVGSAASQELIGSVDTIGSGRPNEPEVGPHGERRAAMEAIDEALGKAIRAFAPRLAGGSPVFDVAEDSAGPDASFADRLSRLAELYPELSLDDMEALALSGDSLVVLAPGPLLALGVLRGDLLRLAETSAKSARAVLARALARGAPPQIEVDRQGQHYLLAALSGDQR